MFADLLFFAKGQGWYDGMTPFKVILVMAVLCWTAKMLLTDYSKTEFFEVAVLLVLALTSWYFSKDKGILINIMILTGMKGISLKRCMKGWIWTFACSYIMAIVLCFMGIYPVYPYLQTKFGMDVFVYRLGYFHPNAFHMTLMMIFMMIIYESYREINRHFIVSIVLLDLLMAMYTLSRTYTLGILVLIVLLRVYCKQENSEHVVLYKMTPYVLPAMLLFAFGTALIPEGNFLQFLTNYITTRFMQAHTFMTSGKFSLFGIDVDNTFNPLRDHYFFLDSSYVSGLAKYGFITFFVIMAIYEWAVLKMRQMKMSMELMLTLFVLFLVTGDPFLLDTSFKNISMYFIGMVFYICGGIHFSKQNDAEQKSIKLLSSYNRNVNVINIPDFIHGQIKMNSRQIALCISGGLILELFFVLSMVLKTINVFTRFCVAPGINDLMSYEGIRGMVSWFEFGAMFTRTAINFHENKSKQFTLFE
jgi:hypothetical protein